MLNTLTFSTPAARLEVRQLRFLAFQQVQTEPRFSNCFHTPIAL